MSYSRGPSWSGQIEDDRPPCCEWRDITIVGSQYEHQLDLVYGYERHRLIANATYRVLRDKVSGMEYAADGPWIDGPPPINDDAVKS